MVPPGSFCQQSTPVRPLRLVPDYLDWNSNRWAWRLSYSRGRCLSCRVISTQRKDRWAAKRADWRTDETQQECTIITTTKSPYLGPATLARNWEIRKFGNSGIRRFGNSEIQEFRNSGAQAFFRSEIQNLGRPRRFFARKKWVPDGSSPLRAVSPSRKRKGFFQGGVRRISRAPGVERGGFADIFSSGRIPWVCTSSGAQKKPFSN